MASPSVPRQPLLPLCKRRTKSGEEVAAGSGHAFRSALLAADAAERIMAGKPSPRRPNPGRRSLMLLDRRHFLAGAAGLSTAGASAGGKGKPSVRANRIAVSTYSFWQFRHKHLRDI